MTESMISDIHDQWVAIYESWDSPLDSITSFETWNVARWIWNYKPLREAALYVRSKGGNYYTFSLYMQLHFIESDGMFPEIDGETPDRTSFNDSHLNHAILDDVIKRLT